MLQQLGDLSQREHSIVRPSTGQGVYDRGGLSIISNLILRKPTEELCSEQSPFFWVQEISIIQIKKKLQA